MHSTGENCQKVIKLMGNMWQTTKNTWDLYLYTNFTKGFVSPANEKKYKLILQHLLLLIKQIIIILMTMIIMVLIIIIMIILLSPKCLANEDKEETFEL